MTEEQVFQKLEEIKAQKERVKRLEVQQELKNQGMNQQGGLIMSIENLPRIKEEIASYQRGESSYGRTTIEKYEKKAAELEKTKEVLERAEKNLTDGAKSLIELGTLNQWAKEPTIYFVKGLQKTALEITEEGDFQLSDRYTPKSEKEQEQAAALLKIANERNQEEETIEVVEEKREPIYPNHYFKVQFNETSETIPDFEGEIVTEELIQQMKQFDNEYSSDSGYYKFYFEEIINGEIVDHGRMDIGDGVEANQEWYDQLQKYAVKGETLPLEESKSEPVHPSVDLSSYVDYPQIKLEEIIQEPFEQMGKEQEGTERYLTQEEVESILDRHLTKIEQMLSNFSNSYELMDQPSNEQKEMLQRGLVETTETVSNQAKTDLLSILSHKKEVVLYQVRESVDDLRLKIKNGFNSRILKINSMIRSFIDKLDLKFSIEEKEAESVEEPEIEELSSVEEESELDLSSGNLSELVHDYLEMIDQKEQISENIFQTIQKDPLVNIEELQKELENHQEKIQKIGEGIALQTGAKLVSKEMVIGLSSLLNGDQLAAEKQTMEKNQSEILEEAKIASKENNLFQASKKESKTKNTPISAVQRIAETNDMKELSAHLSDKMKELFDPNQLKEYLKSAGQLHTYSPNNVQMIREQDPHATQVASQKK